MEILVWCLYISDKICPSGHGINSITHVSSDGPDEATEDDVENKAWARAAIEAPKLSLLAIWFTIVGPCVNRPASEEEISRVIVCLNMLVIVSVYPLAAEAMHCKLWKLYITLSVKMQSNKHWDMNLGSGARKKS